MERRKFIIGTGALAAGGAAALGSGAFTTVEAERDFNAEVADDNDALLRLEPCDGPNGQYAEETDGTVAIDLTSNDYVDNEGINSGLNENSHTKIEDVVKITNQGTQEVLVYVEIPDDIPANDMSITGPVLREAENPSNSGEDAYLSPGESVCFGFFFNMPGSPEEINSAIEDLESIIIHADAEIASEE